MKAKNRKRKLEGRIKEFELLKADRSERGGKVKIISGAGFTRPGSNSK